MSPRSALWAPWRIEYVRGPRLEECIFCESAEPVPDRERLILYRGPNVMAMLNRYPYTNGHLMVAPYAHVPGLTDVGAEIQHDLITCMAACHRILEKVYQPHGLNLGANFGECAGAGVVDHLHFHLVPRWGGDTNFMTTVGEIRVIPEHLERTYDELAPHFEELAGR